MAIKSIEDLIGQANSLMPDNTSDEYLSFVEDITDTINANANNEYNKERYDALDAQWRQRYKERFLSGKPDEQEEEEEDEKPKKLTYESLFKEER